MKKIEIDIVEKWINSFELQIQKIRDYIKLVEEEDEEPPEPIEEPIDETEEPIEEPVDETEEPTTEEPTEK